jgi:hypothetical protein
MGRSLARKAQSRAFSQTDNDQSWRAPTHAYDHYAAHATRSMTSTCPTCRRPAQLIDLFTIAADVEHHFESQQVKCTFEPENRAKLALPRRTLWAGVLSAARSLPWSANAIASERQARSGYSADFVSTYADVPLADSGSFTVEVNDVRLTGPMTRSGREALSIVVLRIDGASSSGRDDTATGACHRLPMREWTAAHHVQVHLEAVLDVLTDPEAAQLTGPDRGRVRRHAQHELGAIIGHTGGEADFRAAVHWNRE